MLMTVMAPEEPRQDDGLFARVMRRLWLALAGGRSVSAPVHTPAAPRPTRAAGSPRADQAADDPLEQTVYGVPLERLMAPEYGPPSRNAPVDDPGEQEVKAPLSDRPIPPPAYGPPTGPWR